MINTPTNRMALIRTRLDQALGPTYLEIIDESSKHIGHAGAQNGAGHYAVIIASPLFANHTQIENHRLIYQILGDLIPQDIHALKIQIKKS